MVETVRQSTRTANAPAAQRQRLRVASAPSAVFYAALAEYNAAYDHMIEGNARDRSDAELDSDMKRHIETSIALVQTPAHGHVAAATLLSIALARILESSPYDLATIQPEALKGCDMDACNLAFIVSALRTLSAQGAD